MTINGIGDEVEQKIPKNTVVVRVQVREKLRELGGVWKR